MTKAQKRVLTEYLTDSARVVHHSMNLNRQGVLLEEAQAFFALRSAFKITGYMTAGEVKW